MEKIIEIMKEVYKHELYNMYYIEIKLGPIRICIVYTKNKGDEKNGKRKNRENKSIQKHNENLHKADKGSDELQ